MSLRSISSQSHCDGDPPSVAARTVSVTVLWSSMFGAFFGLVWAVIGYAFTRGRRDFTSVRQVVSTRFEVLAEHKYAQQARDLLDQR